MLNLEMTQTLNLVSLTHMKKCIAAYENFKTLPNPKHINIVV